LKILLTTTIWKKSKAIKKKILAFFTEPLEVFHRHTLLMNVIHQEISETPRSQDESQRP
jgi:hypothetical protein